MWWKLLRDCIFMVLVLVVGYFALDHYDYKQKTKEQVIAFLQSRGMNIASMNVDVVSPLGVEFSDVHVTDPWLATVGMMRMEMATQTLTMKNVMLSDGWQGKPATFDMVAKFGIDGRNNTIDVQLTGQPMALNADFRLLSAPRKPETTMIEIRTANMQWGGGTLGVRNIAVPMSGVGKEVPITVDVNNVDLAELLRVMLSPLANASGKVNGTVPLVLKEDGHLKFGSGELKAMQAGAIMVPPGAIPAANPEMQLLSEALTDFRYSNLVFTLDSSGGRPYARMLLEGSNPAVYNGQAIKLRVNVGGDVIEFLQTSISLARNPAVVVHEQEAH